MYEVETLISEYIRFVMVGFCWALFVGFVSIAIVAVIHSFKSLAR